MDNNELALASNIRHAEWQGTHVPLGSMEGPSNRERPTCTIADVLSGDAAPWLESLAAAGARKGRYCGGRGRRQDYGTKRDTGGMPATWPVIRQCDPDDAEAATDAVGVFWSRCKAGRYGEPSATAPLGALYGIARNMGRLAAQRRIRESALDAESVSARRCDPRSSAILAMADSDSPLDAVRALLPAGLVAEALRLADVVLDHDAPRSTAWEARQRLASMLAAADIVPPMGRQRARKGEGKADKRATAIR